MKLLSKNVKLVKSFPGQRVGSFSRLPIVDCVGAPCGGCNFTDAEGKAHACYCLRILKMYPSVRKHCEAMSVLKEDVWALVDAQLTKERINVFRPFTSGEDFISQKDIDGFYSVARKHPAVKFYAYTKSCHHHSVYGRTI